MTNKDWAELLRRAADYIERTHREVVSVMSDSVSREVRVHVLYPGARADDGYREATADVDGIRLTWFGPPPPEEPAEEDCA